MDATRTEHDYLCRVVEAAIRAGATTINIPDTVGYATPEEYFDLIMMLRNRVPGIDKVVISTHCHDDLGLAVANSLAGLRAGARQIECTINGLGERAGNAALEEVVMAIRTRHDLLPYRTGIRSEMLARASKLVSAVTNFPVQYNKAIVGRNAFAHESGIHQDGVLKNTSTYEIMTPESVGVGKSSLVMGKHSGRAAFRSKLKELVTTWRERFRGRVQSVQGVGRPQEARLRRGHRGTGRRGRGASQRQHQGRGADRHSGYHGPQTATLTLDMSGQTKTVQTVGNGPVDATFNAIKLLVPHEARLDLYQVHAVTEGTDAQAESRSGWKRRAGW